MIASTFLVLAAGYASAKPVKPASAKHGHGHSKRKASWKKKGQQGINADRAKEIQTALIREKYLTGEPTGAWDARTQAALVKYQADNGWQSKVVPDSRALIKLGLGPNYSAESLLNSPANTSQGSVTSAASRSATSSTEK
ncbi:MAG: peptidoglycan-binding domain-containing protein [Candidatus Angelobacter sp.]